MKKYLCELFGTLVLVLFACGTATVTGCNSASADAAYLMTALSFGLVIVAMAYSVGRVSGCHINPAVSVGMWISGRLCTKDLIGYVIAQFIGAIGGALILAVLVGFDASLGCNALYNNNIALTLLVETILTFVFVLVILGVTANERYADKAGIVIGLTLTLVHIFGIRFTGTSVNPARSFGPALIKCLSGDVAALGIVWIFIVAPILGGVLAAACWKYIATKSDI